MGAAAGFVSQAACESHVGLFPTLLRTRPKRPAPSGPYAGSRRARRAAPGPIPDLGHDIAHVVGVQALVKRRSVEAPVPNAERSQRATAGGTRAGIVRQRGTMTSYQVTPRLNVRACWRPATFGRVRKSNLARVASSTRAAGASDGQINGPQRLAQTIHDTRSVGCQPAEWP
jgi:hypothetical protein